jgi:hypothetical protein
MGISIITRHACTVFERIFIVTGHFIDVGEVAWQHYDGF